jgi:protein-serine/threonine kinase
VCLFGLACDPFSNTLADTLFRLICEPQHRLNVDQIKQHPFFRGVRWDTIRSQRAPFIPELKSITDTSYFDDIPDVPLQVGGELPSIPSAGAGPIGLQNQNNYYSSPVGSPTQGGGSTVSSGSEKGTVGIQKDLAFVGYTFKRFDMLTRRGGI